MELRRRKPSGARMGDAIPLQNRDRAGPRGHSLLGTLLPGTDVEFQLVGKPQGPARTQRLRRWVPWAGQHRSLRPQRAAADWWTPGSGRWYRMDGFLLPVHA